MQAVAGVCLLLFVAYLHDHILGSDAAVLRPAPRNKTVIALMQVVLGILANAILLGYQWAVWSAAVAYALIFASHLLHTGIGILVLVALITS